MVWLSRDIEERHRARTVGGVRVIWQDSFVTNAGEVLMGNDSVNMITTSQVGLCVPGVNK